MKPHKHAELIKAWADGATIEAKALGQWMELERNFVWHEDLEYRIKPEPKPDVAMYYIFDGSSRLMGCNNYGANIRLVVDGETGELKSAEVLK